MNKQIENDVKTLSVPSAFPNNTPCRVLSVDHVIKISRDTGTIGKVVETIALENNIIPERYMRNMHTYSAEDQIRLLEANITVVGLGGLGGTVVEILARAGIGTLRLVDGDVFEGHNLNRQLVSTPDLLGAPKSDAAGSRVSSINPSIEAICVNSFITKTNSDQLIKGSHLVVDCLDNITSRFILEKAAKKAGIPMASTAIAGMAGQITTIFPEDKGLELIYGPLDRVKADKGAETDLGCPPQTVLMMASMECATILDFIVGKKRQLQNKLLIVDLSDFTVETLKLA